VLTLIDEKVKRNQHLIKFVVHKLVLICNSNWCWNYLLTPPQTQHSSAPADAPHTERTQVSAWN